MNTPSDAELERARYIRLLNILSRLTGLIDNGLADDDWYDDWDQAVDQAKKLLAEEGIAAS